MTLTPSEFIVQYMDKSGALPQKQELLLKCRYLDLGLISSFEIINFIMELEELFGINLTPEETQSDEFRTVGGVITMVEAKIKSL
jgi:acyl carrier protein